MKKTEQLIEELQKLINSPDQPVFSDEEYEAFRLCGFTEEQIKGFEETELATNAIDLLPTEKADLDKLSAALYAISGKDAKKNIENMALIASKDPTRFAQILALATVIENELASENPEE